jgi:two-component system cell cycle response regulator CpdR
MQHVPAPTALRILFVEDNAYLREQILELLAAEDRELVGCGSAEEALAKLQSRSFDVLITDISLPHMSGIDLARHVLKTCPDAWIVISSGYLPRLTPEALGENVRVLPKPFEIEQMDALLRDARTALSAIR